MRKRNGKSILYWRCHNEEVGKNGGEMKIRGASDSKANGKYNEDDHRKSVHQGDSVCRREGSGGVISYVVNSCFSGLLICFVLKKQEFQMKSSV